MSPTLDPPTIPFVAAVDAGGTKTVAALEDLEGRLLGRGSSGPGNPSVAGVDASRRSISTALHSAVAEARLQCPNLAQRAELLRIGIAGVELDEHARPFAQWAKAQGLCQRAIASNDAHLVFDLGSNVLELALIAGTGSTCWAHHPSGQTRRVGGWGYLADDRGSGFALGSAALNLAVRSLDGRDSLPDFEAIVFEHWRAKDEAGLLEKLHVERYADARRHIAALSIKVFALADGGSSQATQLVDTIADDLAELVRGARRSLEDQAGASLVFAGSMLAQRESLRQAVLDRLDFKPLSWRTCPEPVLNGLTQAVRASRS